MERSPKYCAFPVDARFKYPIDFSLPPSVSPPAYTPRTPLDTPPALYVPENKPRPRNSIELPFDANVTNVISFVFVLFICLFGQMFFFVMFLAVLSYLLVPRPSIFATKILAWPLLPVLS